MAVKRKAGGYWTVQYRNADGTTYNIGHFGSRQAVLASIILETENYPEGYGKIIFTK